MKNIFSIARNKAGYTMEEAAPRLFVTRRTLCKYENEKPPNPDIVMQMAEVYNAPEISNAYCKYYCPIGKAYSYQELNNINDDIPTVLIKLRSEMKEAHDIIDDLMDLSVNNEFENNLQEFQDYIQELLDVEHNIEILKIQLHHHINVRDMIDKHNQKCIDRGYSKNAKTH